MPPLAVGEEASVSWAPERIDPFESDKEDAKTSLDEFGQQKCVYLRGSCKSQLPCERKEFDSTELHPFF